MKFVSIARSRAGFHKLLSWHTFCGFELPCEDSRCSRLLAAKLTPYRSEQRQLVLREYQVLRRLSHQHLVQLHAAILTPSCLVLIEELCSGRELLYNLADSTRTSLSGSFLLQRPQLILLDAVDPSWWYAYITLDSVAL
ncbi:obscurin-like, partial [Astyanax mexicanus]